MEIGSRRSEVGTVSVFFGDASDAIARVYARLEGPGEALRGLSLAGRVIGPFCEYAATLPAHVPLIDKGSSDAWAGNSLIAEAVVPDPCFWMPELPFLYRVHVEVRRAGEPIETIERPLGIRALGPRGRSLYLSGKRFVIRGVCRDEPPTIDELREWHEPPAALCVASPSDTLCEAASRLGVLIVAEICDSQAMLDEIRRLGRWPAVGVAILPALGASEPELRRAAPNLLLAQRIAPASQPADWAQLVVCEAEELQQSAARVKDFGLPILARRRATAASSLSAARAACDRLQADLAPIGDFAGYLV